MCIYACMHACMCVYVHVHVHTYLYIPSYEEIQDANFVSIKTTSVISDAQDVSCTSVCEKKHTTIYIYIYI